MDKNVASSFFEWTIHQGTGKSGTDVVIERKYPKTDVFSRKENPEQEYL